jgi:hypothetical protein
MKKVSDFIDNPEQMTFAEVFVFMLNQRKTYPCPSNYLRCDMDGYGSGFDKIDLNTVPSPNLSAMVNNLAIMVMLKEYAPNHYNAVIDHRNETGHDYFSREFGASKEDFQELFKKMQLTRIIELKSSMIKLTDFTDNPEKIIFSEIFSAVLIKRMDYPSKSDYFQCDLDGYGSCSDKVDFNNVNGNLRAIECNRALISVLKNYAPNHYNAVIDHWNETGHDYFHRDMASTKADFQELFKQYNLPE